jgi:hypothetical protein
MDNRQKERKRWNLFGTRDPNRDVHGGFLGTNTPQNVQPAEKGGF